MDAPNYIAHVEAVANRYDGKKSLEQLYTEMCQCWSQIENYAKGTYPQYGILEGHGGNTLLETMVSLLYKVDAGATAALDADIIKQKDREYGGSWHQRGGAGAFFMLCRKWDRLAQGVKNYGTFTDLMREDDRPEGVRDDIGDLRRYLILVLAWHAASVVDPQQDIPF